MFTLTRCNNVRMDSTHSRRQSRRKGRVSRNGRYAFTLVELLVVVAIIALLVSILLPTLSKAKDAARAVVCATNLKAIMLATALYAHEYDGWVHAAFGGYEAGHGLGGPDAAGDGYGWDQVMTNGGFLPDDDSDLSYCPLTNAISKASSGWYSYGMRASYASGSGGYYGADGLYGTGYFHIESPLVQRRAGLESNSVFTYDYCPGEFVLYMDSRREAFFYKGIYPVPAMQWYIVFDVPCSPGDEDCRVHLRHNDRANCAFADGHAAPMGRDRLNQSGFEDGSIWPEP